MKPRPSYRHLFAIATMVGSAACWGGATVMSRDLLTHFSPPTLLLIQLAASVALLWLLALANRPWRYWHAGLGRASLTGLLEPGLTYSIGLWGLALTSAGHAAVISASEPMLILLLVWLLFRQRPTGKLLGCIVLAFAGLLLVSADSALDANTHSVGGDVLIVLSTVFAASYVVFSSRLVGQFPAAVLASAQQTVGLVYAGLLYLAASLSGLLRPWAELDGTLLAYAAASGIVQYALAFWLYLLGLTVLSPGAAALWLTLIPVFGVSGAFFWLGEVPTFSMLTGMLLILAAVGAGRQER